MTDPAAAAATAHRLYWGRVLSATLRMARDVDIAEEATADAFLLALQTWPERGVPDSVEAWLLTAARRRAIDRIRRLVRFRERVPTLAADATTEAAGADHGVVDAPVVADDELRLVVLCCHPAIDQEAQVALTLRLGCGVPTASIAAAFLVSTPTMAARLTRAKHRIAGAGTGIDLPDDVAVEERMPAVRRTLHLTYTMGHTAGSGAALRDDDLAAHAVRLARALHELRPGDTEYGGPVGAGAAHRGAGRRADPVTGHPGAARRRRSLARGTPSSSPRAWRSSAAPPAPAPARSCCRPPSPPTTPGRRRSRPPTGAASSTTTTPCCSPSRARRSPSGAASPCRTSSARRPGWPTSTRCSTSVDLERVPVRPRRPRPAARAPRSGRTRRRRPGSRAAGTARTDAERAWFEQRSFAMHRRPTAG